MKLRVYLDENSITHAAFAEAIGVSQQTVSRYVVGERFPRLEIMGRIVQATENAVTPNDFLSQTHGGDVA